MKLRQIFEARVIEAETPTGVVCIYAGRFHPFHKGHKAVFDAAVKAYGMENCFIATSNKTDGGKSPFSFEEKKQMMMLTGVPEDRIVECRVPYQPKEILDNYDSATTVAKFMVGAKDMDTDPRFRFGTKKDGSPTYLQDADSHRGNYQTFDQHAYVVTAPTLNFNVLGQPATSATELRAQYATLDDQTAEQFITDLFGQFDESVMHILDGKLHRQAQEPAQTEESFNFDDTDSLLESIYQELMFEEDIVRRVQSNGQTTNFNIDKSKPATTWTKGNDTMTLYGTPEDIKKAQEFGSLKGWAEKKAAEPAVPEVPVDKDGNPQFQPGQQYGTVDGVGIENPNYRQPRDGDEVPVDKDGNPQFHPGQQYGTVDGVGVENPNYRQPRDGDEVPVDAQGNPQFHPGQQYGTVDGVGVENPNYDPSQAPAPEPATTQAAPDNKNKAEPKPLAPEPTKNQQPAGTGTAANQGAGQPKGVQYAIKPGDNLTKIAKANGTTVDAIMKANPQIKDANKIQAGAKLNLPAGTAANKDAGQPKGVAANKDAGQPKGTAANKDAGQPKGVAANKDAGQPKGTAANKDAGQPPANPRADLQDPVTASGSDDTDYGYTDQAQPVKVQAKQKGVAGQPPANPRADLQDPVTASGSDDTDYGYTDQAQPTKVQAKQIDKSKLGQGQEEPGMLDKAADAASGAWDTVKGWFGGDDEQGAAPGGQAAPAQQQQPQNAQQAQATAGKPVQPDPNAQKAQGQGAGAQGNIADIKPKQAPAAAPATPAGQNAPAGQGAPQAGQTQTQQAPVDTKAGGANKNLSPPGPDGLQTLTTSTKLPQGYTIKFDPKKGNYIGIRPNGKGFIRSRKAPRVIQKVKADVKTQA